ncbi:flavin-containing monooxygenase [Nocardia mangyaensis]|uniref:flavin-containing monooxygenase n=1 Tax=Nocardia mangyaensis TaxID=2213200 RepID=UPI0026775952|nr:NAD(P)/FAD-dependent oxidoreductase [Nocardia mangyaensis]MDO3649682.1 NAD(P)/FAD-dependent oxidoreductase [Nocardia mangyaensis]
MSPQHEVVVIGAGISGICAAIQLAEAGVDDVVLVDRADTFGGTWRANTYPGCACDVPSGLYSFSFAPNSEWSRLFATQPEILEYVDRVAREHGLAERTRFGVEVTGARWDDDARRWRLDTSDGELTARFVVSAAGPWNEPRFPDIPGLAEFPGEVFHSARWNHDYDLRGKRVAVVGTGASAVQFVPEIQREVAALHLFQRTAQWVLPKPDHSVPGIEKRMMRRLPFAHRALRSVEYALMEGLGVAFRNPRPLMQAVQTVGSAYLRAVVRDPALRAKLTPDYLLGCKRILFSNSYLQSLTKPNVAVHATAVTEFRGNTALGADGSAAEVDAVILGTGFHILDTPLADIVRGADGRTMAEHWQGSPEAYLGTVTTGFPNAFTVLGPSLGTGHSSAFAILEAQVAYLVSAIASARRESWAVLDVRSDVQADYVDQVQDALAGTVYNAGGCQSYYLDANGRNSFSWPWSTGELTRRVSAFDPADFTITHDDVAIPA